MAMNSSFTALPDDVLQRVLLGVPLDDHDATAAACRAFRDVIRGPRYPALRRGYGFAERGIILVRSREIFGPSGAYLGPVEIHVASKHGAVARIDEDLKLKLRGSTTDGGARLFVGTTRHLRRPPHEILAVDASARRWSRFATVPLGQRLHCLEWHGGLLYVAGGHVDEGVNRGYINTLHAFNETTGSWDDLPPMPHACARAASGVIGNELFIAGGIGSGDEDLSTLQIYDFTTRTWRLGPTLPHAEYRAEGVVVGDGKLYLVRRRLGTTRRMLVYDVQSNTWSNQPKPAYRLAVDVKYAFAHKGRIVAVNSTGSALQLGTGSDWSRFDLDVGPAILHTGYEGSAVAGSVLLG